MSLYLHRCSKIMVAEDGYIVLSALQPDTIGRRLQSDKNTMEEKGDLDE